jgi:carbonic anhydrase
VATEVFPLELHFVHADAAGTLAVVGVLLEVGEANPSYDVLWDAQTPGGESTVADFDLTTLLPGNLRRYRYAGSLTTPPCTEGVNWNVVAEPASLSQAQLDGFLYDGNARPVQELGSRTVLADQS